jgi:hypothetical protein
MMPRVMSAGDLQQAPAHAPAPAARYSAEERRERIEKYRTKRNQRNFQKKITVRPFSSCYLVISIAMRGTFMVHSLGSSSSRMSTFVFCFSTLAGRRWRTAGRA